MNNIFGGLFWNNPSKFEDYRRHEPIEWEGHYDKTKHWHFVGTNNVCGTGIEDNVIFVNGDITSLDCFLALKKEYNSMNELLYIHFAYPEGLDPARIGGESEYKNILKIDDFKNAVIISVRHWTNANRTYYIVSKKERQLYMNYKECPSDYFIDGKQVSYDDYMHKMYASIKIDDVNLITGTELKIKTFVEQDRLFKNRKKIIKAVEQASLEKSFIRVSTNTEKYRLMEHFYTPLLNEWFKKSEWDAMVEKLKKPHIPYVIKGTNKPPYFMIDDYIVNADTSSWYEFILKWYFDDKVQDWMLEKMNDA